MKKLLLVLVLALAPALALAQSGVFPANTVWGNATGSAAQPKAVPFINFPAKLIVGGTIITGGATTNVLYDNAGVLGEYTATSTPTGTVVLRDANLNTFSNNHFDNAASTVSAGGTTVLTAASARYQALTGSSNQTFQLPDATTLSIGPVFTFNNNSSGSLIITNAGGSTQYTVPAGGLVTVGPTNISTSNGVWDAHPSPPSTVTWGSGTTGLVMNSALSTTPSITAGAPSSTVPAFIPQRATPTYGFGGDSTHIYGITGGVAAITSTTAGTTIPNLSATTSFTATGSFTATNLVGLGNLAQSGANTMLGNWSGSTADVAANAMPSCADSGGNHLNYVSGTGITCGTSSTGNGYVLLNTLTASASASLSDTTSFTSTYSTYDIVFINVVPATNGTTCRIRVNSGGVQTTTYLSTYGGDDSAGDRFGTSTTFIFCSITSGTNNNPPGISGTFTLVNPSQTASPKMIHGTMSFLNTVTPSIFTGHSGGYWNGGNGAVTGIQIDFDSGNITSGTVKIYGKT